MENSVLTPEIINDFVKQVKESIKNGYAAENEKCTMCNYKTCLCGTSFKTNKNAKMWFNDND